MRDVDPADVAVAMLKEALPGFESRIVPERDVVAIRGALPIATTVSAETIRFPLYRNVYRESPTSRAFREALHALDEIREARDEAERAAQIEALKRELAPLVENIVEGVQRFAIKAVNLEPMIAERERKARERGKREGWAAGDTEGYARGRREAMADMVAAFRDAGFSLDEIAGIDE